MDEARSVTLKLILDTGLKELYGLWEEIGFDTITQRDRNETVESHFKMVLEQMILEENLLKKQLVESLEQSMKECVKLSKELDTSYEDEDSNLSLLKMDHLMKGEVKRLETMKEKRIQEMVVLCKNEEILCMRLGLDPYYVSYESVPSSQQIQDLKEHIQRLEEERWTRMEQLVKMKETILSLYNELEEEPVSELEREIICETDTERFVLSTVNIAAIKDILKRLQEKVVTNKNIVNELMKKLEKLYDLLQLDPQEKVHFLSDIKGHNSSIISRMSKEVERLIEIKKANIDKLVISLRKELSQIWDKCFYTEEQRNKFISQYSSDFTEELLEKHEAEVAKLKKYFLDNKEIFDKVSQRQKIWNQFVELERRSKDSSRLLNARGSNLLMEEKERNKVNKTLPKVEQELETLIGDWERVHQEQFLVRGVTFKEFIETQMEDKVKQLEKDKHTREMQRKETMSQDPRYEAKLTPVRLGGHDSARVTPKRKHLTPGNVTDTMRSPMVGRVDKGTWSRKTVNKNVKVLVMKEMENNREICLENSWSPSVSRGMKESLTLAVPDYNTFKQSDSHNFAQVTNTTCLPVVARTQQEYTTPVSRRVSSCS